MMSDQQLSGLSGTVRAAELAANVEAWMATRPSGVIADAYERMFVYGKADD
jgi:hypothetical protein